MNMLAGNINNPTNVKELLAEINSLSTQIELTEVELKSQFDKLKSQFSPGTIFKFIASSLFSAGKGSSSIQAATLSAGLGAVLRNFIVPGIAKNLIGGVAVNATQNLIANLIVGNREKIEHWMSSGIHKLRNVFSRNNEQTNNYEAN